MTPELFCATSDLKNLSRGRARKSRSSQRECARTAGAASCLLLSRTLAFPERGGRRPLPYRLPERERQCMDPERKASAVPLPLFPARAVRQRRERSLLFSALPEWQWEAHGSQIPHI